MPQRGVRAFCWAALLAFYAGVVVYLALKEPDPAKAEAVANRLDNAVREGKLGRPGLLGRKLFPDHPIVAKSLLLELRLCVTQAKLIAGTTKALPKVDPERLLTEYFRAYLNWDLDAVGMALRGWDQWQQTDHLPQGAAEGLRANIGGDCEVNAFFNRIAADLAKDFDPNIVRQGCIARLKERVLAVQPAASPAK